MLLGLTGVVGWKLVNNREVKPTELLSAAFGLWGFFNK